MTRYKVVNSRQSQVSSDTGRLVVDDGSGYTLPTATADIKGGVRVGANLSMAGDVLSADDMRYDSQVLTDIGDLEEGQQGLQDQIDAIPTVPGPPGDSAYEIAVGEGFIGTEQEWLDSQGRPGRQGRSRSSTVPVRRGPRCPDMVGERRVWLGFRRQRVYCQRHQRGAARDPRRRVCGVHDDGQLDRERLPDHVCVSRSLGDGGHAAVPVVPVGRYPSGSVGLVFGRAVRVWIRPPPQHAPGRKGSGPYVPVLLPQDMTMRTIIMYTEHQHRKEGLSWQPQPSR